MKAHNKESQVWIGPRQFIAMILMVGGYRLMEVRESYGTLCISFRGNRLASYSSLAKKLWGPC